jgi:hypothetical protein
VNRPAYELLSEWGELDNEQDASGLGSQAISDIAKATRQAREGGGVLTKNPDQQVIVLRTNTDGTCNIWTPKTVGATKNPLPLMLAKAEAKKKDKKLYDDYFDFYCDTEFNDGASVATIEENLANSVSVFQKAMNWVKGAKRVPDGAVVKVTFSGDGYPDHAVIKSPIRDEKNKAIVIKSVDDLKSLSGLKTVLEVETVSNLTAEEQKKIISSTREVRKRILKIAKSQKVIKWEDLPGSARKKKRAEYFEATHWYRYGRGTSYSTGDSWCMAFVSWCCEKAGFPLRRNGISGFVNVGSCYRYFKSLGRIKQMPEPGYIVFFASKGKPNHVGFVLSVGRNSDGTIRTVKTIEGNYSNKVKEVNRVKTINKIIGYANPVK